MRACANTMTPSISYLPGLQLLCLAVAVTAGLIAAASYWRRHRPTTNHGALASMAARMQGKITYHDAPTVRVVDSQRVDRVRKIARLKPGEFLDALETRAGLPPRLRITLKGLAVCDQDPLAHVAVEFGGTAVSCGPLVQEIGFNEYVLARANRDEPRNTIFHYQESGGALSFMRIKLRAIDVAAGWAEIDVMQVSGHWPATTDRQGIPAHPLT